MDETRNVLHQHNLYIFRNNKLTNTAFRDNLVSGNYGTYADNSNVMPVFVPTSGLTFRLDILKKVYPIPIDFKVCADGYLTRTSLAFGEVSSGNYFGGAYRDHENNATFGNSEYNQSKYLHNILLPHLFNFYIKKQIPWRFGYATDSEYSENIDKICVEQNSEVLIFRSACVELSQKLIDQLLINFPLINAHLLLQKDSLEKFKNLSVKIKVIENGPISKKSIPGSTFNEISGINFELIIIPLSTWEIGNYSKIIKLAISFKAKSTLLVYPNGSHQDINSTIEVTD